MDCYDCYATNEQAGNDFASPISLISNDQATSPWSITSGPNHLSPHPVSNPQDSPWSFFDIEENMTSWESGITSAEIGNMNTDVAMFAPTFSHQLTGLSMSDFVDPGALSQENPQDIFDFWLAMHQQQSGLAANAQAQVFQQPKQGIDHFPPEPSTVPPVGKGRSAKNNMNKERKKESRRQANRVAALNSQHTDQLEKDVARLEEEVAGLKKDVALKTNENNDLRNQNHTLMKKMHAPRHSKGFFDIPP
ncbi:hypothetical protein K469DRAFT_690765 [Zopfia rhizophila CBS 207.26]|uniref:BZIP domain-containing protein n=1 Tax=Zopfia rhizophila CBS 207.26 TaxID=1314779 RepID=A0A6A6DWD1_9PEZI|nr:hypothetical protein K469DRAFT_690765 [Zopfia rhizophila CBS 207.26]